MKVEEGWKKKLEENAEEIKQIYDLMDDTKSKDIYRNLLLLQYTGNVKYLIETIRLNGFEPDEALFCYRKLMQCSEEGNRPLILYGLGRNAEAQFKLAREKRGACGYLFYPFMTDIKWTAYCDKQLQGTLYMSEGTGKRILSPKEMVTTYPNALICITSDTYFDEISMELKEFGVEEEDICQYIPPNVKVFEENQYFNNEYMNPQRETYFVDGGCYRLDTVERFCQWNGEWGMDGFLAFEPDPVNHRICNERLNMLKVDEKVRANSRVIHAGLSDCVGQMHFSPKGTDEACFSEDGEIAVPVTTIDEVVGEYPVSFIKLDVEGFELQALQGGKKTIQRWHPRIAICAYHKLSDLIDIPKYLLDLNMGYRLDIRMYCNEYLEIVIYAR